MPPLLPARPPAYRFGTGSASAKGPPPRPAPPCKPTLGTSCYQSPCGLPWPPRSPTAHERTGCAAVVESLAVSDRNVGPATCPLVVVHHATLNVSLTLRFLLPRDRPTQGWTMALPRPRLQRWPGSARHRPSFETSTPPCRPVSLCPRFLRDPPKPLACSRCTRRRVPITHLPSPLSHRR